ncbi:MAG: AAA family ATPase [Candidatus Andersenbacteria bacterium]
MKLGDAPLQIDTRRLYGRRVFNIALRSPILVTIAILSTLAGTGMILFSASSSLMVGLGLVLWAVSAAAWLIYTYASTTLPHEKPRYTVQQLLESDGSINNGAYVLTWEAIEAIGSGTDKDLTMHDVVAQIVAHPKVTATLEFMEIPAQELQEVLERHVVPDLTLPKLVHTAAFQVSVRSESYVGVVDLLVTLLLHPQMRNPLRQFELQEHDVLFVGWWYGTMQRERAVQKRWWDPDRLVGFTGVGLSWAAGYTPFIDNFIRIPSGNIWDQPYGHKEQAEQLITTLARARQGNVLLVGQPGVGRLGIIKYVAQLMNQQKAHDALNGQRMIYINVGQLLSLGSSGPEQMQFISRALAEMERAGNIVAVLDGLGSVLGKAGEDRINLTDVLLPFFSSAKVRVVVIMSTDEYHERVKTNEDLLHLFEIVQVPPLSGQETLQLLALTRRAWEDTTDVRASYKVLREIVEATEHILPYVPFPEKAFDVLEELIVTAQGKKQKDISSTDVHDLIAHKTGIQLGKVKELEGRRLLHLEDFIHRRVVNQEQGVMAVSRAMIRARTGVRSRTKPIGTFLFLGPTGVGKTETAKALAEAFFGSEEYLQRLDMTEFQGEDGVQRLIGSSGQKTGRLTSLVADHPYAVLLLDEFEKADLLVKQLFLPVFDEGYISDAYGRKYSFRNTIIVATSNAGAELIRTSVDDEGKVPPGFEKDLREHILSQQLFRPEELNRFDGVVTFTPLSPDHIRQIAVLMLKKLNKRLDAEHGITVVIDDALLDFLVKTGYNADFGARPMARAIQDTVEYAVARQIAASATHPGQQITINPEQFAVT